jgi:hypothetical protein
MGGVGWAKSGSKAFGDYFVVSRRQKQYGDYCPCIEASQEARDWNKEEAGLG